MSCTLQTSIDLSHLYGSFQSHHLQALIAHICEVARHADQVQTSWLHLRARGQGFEKDDSKKKKPYAYLCLTLWDCFKKLRVSDDLTVLHLWHAIRFLGLAPEVGAPMHAGYVEDSYALQ